MLCTHYASYKTNDPEHWFCKTHNGCIALQCLTIKNPKFGIPYDIGNEGHTIYNKDFSKILISMIDATLDNNQYWYNIGIRMQEYVPASVRPSLYQHGLLSKVASIIEIKIFEKSLLYIVWPSIPMS